jgi:hypothetical protein
MGRIRSRYGGDANAHRNLFGKPKGKRKYLRPWHRMEHNIKMNLKKKQDDTAWSIFVLFRAGTSSEILRIR